MVVNMQVGGLVKGLMACYCIRICWCCVLVLWRMQSMIDESAWYRYINGSCQAGEVEKIKPSQTHEECWVIILQSRQVIIICGLYSPRHR